MVAVIDRILLCGDPVVGLGDPPIIPDGAVLVEGNRVSAVGSRTEMIERHGRFAEVLGGPGHVVLPGFVNSHSHTGPALGPGLFDEIFERGSLNMGPGHGPIDPGIVRLKVLGLLIDAVRGGQTSLIDFNYGRWGMPDFAWDHVLAAYHEMGFRVALGVVFRDQNVYAHQPNEDFLRRFSTEIAAEIRDSKIGYAWPVADVVETFENLTSGWHGRGELSHIALAPDWTPACSDDLYRLCRRLADEHGTVISTHALESRSEMVWNLKTHGVVAMRRLADLGLLGPDVSVAHFVWATDEDIRILADTGTIAVTNPGSNLRLASGIARLRPIMERGGRVAFGTDGVSFSDREDFFAEMRLAAQLARTPDHFLQGRLDSLALLRAAGDNGAAVLGWPGELGRLAPGYLADAIVVSRDRIFHPRGRYDSTPVLDVILDRADQSDVAHVVINGKVVLRDGTFTTVDEQAIRDAMAEAIAAAPPPSVEARRGAELAELAAPELERLYEPWYRIPLEPATLYNTARPPTL
jgi:5-methylthioadenosine/S-adenosylhomocysteine deaminase